MIGDAAFGGEGRAAFATFGAAEVFGNPAEGRLSLGVGLCPFLPRLFVRFALQFAVPDFGLVAFAIDGGRPGVVFLPFFDGGATLPFPEAGGDFASVVFGEAGPAFTRPALRVALVPSVDGRLVTTGARAGAAFFGGTMVLGREGPALARLTFGLALAVFVLDGTIVLGFLTAELFRAVFGRRVGATVLGRAGAGRARATLAGRRTGGLLRTTFGRRVGVATAGRAATLGGALTLGRDGDILGAAGLETLALGRLTAGRVAGRETVALGRATVRGGGV